MIPWRLADAAIITNMTFTSALFTWSEHIVVEDGIWFRSRLLPREPEQKCPQSESRKICFG